VLGLHEGVDEGYVVVVGQSVGVAELPVGFGRQQSVGADAVAGEFADAAVEALWGRVSRTWMLAFSIVLF
jgi:hypothetical protein